jgi:hypothetical protein
MVEIILGLLVVALIPAFIAKSKGRSFFLWYIYGIFLFLFAFIHVIVLKPNENAAGMKKCSSCSSIIPATALICPACRTSFTDLSAKLNQEVSNFSENIKIDKFLGEANISSSKYQLYLTKKFNIEKNNTLEKFIIEDQVYNSLDEALSAADLMYVKELEEENNRRIKIEADRDAKERSQLKEAEMHRIEEELRLQKKREEDERLAPVRAANKKKFVVFLTVFFILFSGFVSYFLYQQKKEREAKELVEKIEREKILEKMRLDEKERLEQQEKIKEDLAKFFSTGVFFGFKIGDNNLENLSKISKKPFEKNVLGGFYLTCLEGQCLDLLKDTPFNNVFKKIQFTYCVPDAQEFKGQKFFKMTGFEIEFKEYREVIEYRKYLDANVKVPSPPQKIIQNYNPGGISLKWERDLQIGSYYVKDICDNRRDFFGGRPYKF